MAIMMKTTYLLLYAALTATVLVGCGSPSVDRTQKPLEQAHASTADQIQQLLSDAQNSDSPRREQQLLTAAQLLLQEQQRDLAGQLINSVNPQRLPLTQYAFYAQVACQLNIQRGLYEEARRVLEAPRLLNSIDNLQPRTQLNLSLLRAEVFALLGSHLASAQQRIYIGPLLDPSEQLANREGIWQSLTHVSINDLQRYQQTALSEEYRGWLELALIGKDSQGDLDEQVRQLEDWQVRWSTHPASQNLPGGLELLKELANNRPQQIALMLPLTGKLASYGKAIRDGFVAAMYQTRQKGGQIPRLKFYDTEKSEDFVALYNQATADGAQMVVGPLEKHRVRQLFDLTLPVPTLALNRIDDYGKPAQQLFQFGLAPQDEARQIASIAYLENHRKALVVAPKGEWGEKVTNSFSAQWQQLGGETIAASIYSGQKDYSSSIKKSLLLDKSESRAKRIQRLAGEHIEFTPRRRDDIDMVFLLARPAQARSIKPLFAYHYAGGLPIYGTSHLYSGVASASKDRDINGVRFTDMPWVLDPPSDLHQQIDRELPQGKQYQRMFALGVDSYQLHPRLRQLDEISSSRVYGQTGTLKLNERNEIEREMLYSQIKRGVAKIIPRAHQTLNLTAVTKDGTNYGNNMER
jgi:uncharacterized protein